jgi:glycerol-3-phosphate dehydrogenase
MRASAPPFPLPSLRPFAAAMPICDRETTERADVVVIGGGINGTGVARDLAMRGLRVVLFERNDLAFGASGNSSGMIHGGARYLTQDPGVTKASCQDSGYIQQIAPFLLFRIPFLMPIKAGLRGRMAMELIDAFFGLYDDYQPLKRGKPHTRLSPSDLARLEPGLTGSLVGGVTFDEWGVDGSRLCVLNAVDAKERGAKLYMHTSVEGISRKPGGELPSGRGGATGPDSGTYIVHARHRVSGKSHRTEANMVINATGAWGPITASLGSLEASRVRVRPGKGVHVAFDRRISNYAIWAEAVDGRSIFIEPWQNMSVIGTTDDDYYGSLDDVYATSEEIRYLVQGIARVLPEIRRARAISTWAGVRPTLYSYGPVEDKLSREHMIVDHAKEGAPGVYSMIGGKLASYRAFAEEMSTVVAGALCPSTKCRTHEIALPGGDVVLDAMQVASRHAVDPIAARRLIFRHGARASIILQRAQVRPRECLVVCPCEPVLEAEIRHVIREELAETVEDVSRRTRLGLGSCGGMRCAARCGQIVAEELQYSPLEGRRQALVFLHNQAKRRIVALSPEQARQEVFARQAVLSTLGEIEDP